MRKVVELMMKRARETDGAMIGVDVGALNLTKEEKRVIVNQGYSLTKGLYHSLILAYTQKSRQNDLRKKVLGRRKK